MQVLRPIFAGNYGFWKIPGRIRAVKRAVSRLHTHWFKYFWRTLFGIKILFLLSTAGLLICLESVDRMALGTIHSTVEAEKNKIMKWRGRPWRPGKGQDRHPTKGMEGTRNGCGAEEAGSPHEALLLAWKGGKMGTTPLAWWTKYLEWSTAWLLSSTLGCSLSNQLIFGFLVDTFGHPWYEKDKGG